MSLSQLFSGKGLLAALAVVLFVLLAQYISVLTGYVILAAIIIAACVIIYILAVRTYRWATRTKAPRPYKGGNR